MSLSETLPNKPLAPAGNTNYKPYRQHLAEVREAKDENNGGLTSQKWEIFDAVYWRSSIFSRKAMAQNHVRPHKFVERQALGVYRMLACLALISFLVFLTMYEVQYGRDRFYLTYRWWTCLLTWLYFAVVNTNYQAYFNLSKEENKGEQDAQKELSFTDAAHPFVDWKIATHLYCLSFHAAIHLVILECFQDLQKLALGSPLNIDAVPSLVAVVPLILLILDWCANRTYLPLQVSLLFAATCYTLAIPVRFLRADIQLFFAQPLPELEFFTRERMPELSPTVIWLLPVMVTLGFYAANRLKFWYLGEGDLVFDFDEWARYAERRMDWIENDGNREGDFFNFTIKSEDFQNPAINYTEPREIEK